jgi:hypothetical protein
MIEAMTKLAVNEPAGGSSLFEGGAAGWQRFLNSVNQVLPKRGHLLGLLALLGIN